MKSEKWAARIAQQKADKRRMYEAQHRLADFSDQPVVVVQDEDGTIKSMTIDNWDKTPFLLQVIFPVGWRYRGRYRHVSGQI